MSGPVPKAPGLRERRNRAATRAVLGAEEQGRQRAPRLPRLPEGREWQAQTVAWWRDVWRSPMASEYLPADLHGLFILARLVDDFWRAPSRELAAEIRLQRQCFGLTPVDRRRLQWELEPPGQEKARQAAQAPPPPPPGNEQAVETDPRRMVWVVAEAA